MERNYEDRKEMARFSRKERLERKRREVRRNWTILLSVFAIIFFTSGVFVAKKLAADTTEAEEVIIIEDFYVRYIRVEILPGDTALDIVEEYYGELEKKYYGSFGSFFDAACQSSGISDNPDFIRIGGCMIIPQIEEY